MPNEKIGYMPEGLGLYPRLSGYENMRLQFLSAHKNPDKEMILSILNKIDLGEHIISCIITIVCAVVATIIAYKVYKNTKYFLKI